MFNKKITTISEQISKHMALAEPRGPNSADSVFVYL